MPEKILSPNTPIPEIPVFPVKRVERGSYSKFSSGWTTVSINFSKPFDTVPKVILQKTFSGATTEDICLNSVSTTGFSCSFYFSGSGFTMSWDWLAMELNT